MAVPRCCCMRLENKAEGFGFSLVATKNQTGQYIDEVREGSLADMAGLKNGDFVVEVNGENILSYSHPEVVELIKKKCGEVSLLVLDSAARKHYDELSIIVNGNMPEVRRICTWVEGSTDETNSTGESDAVPDKVEKEKVSSAKEVTESSEPTPIPTPQSIDDEESKKTNESTQSPISSVQSSGQSRPPNSSRTTPSRRACMESGTTFGARAKVFDEL